MITKNQCLILAGGLGTRMMPLTETIPKSLLEVSGRPFIDHQLGWLASSGIEEVIVSSGHLGEKIEEYVGNGFNFGINVRFVNEGESRLGTGGALRLAFDWGVLEEKFLVLYGDSYLPIDVKSVIEEFEKRKSLALMTVFENENQEGNNVVFNRETRKIDLYDKRNRKETMTHIDYGMMMFSRDVIERNIESGEVVDLADVLSRLSLTGDLDGFEVFDRFYEVGSMEGLKDLENFLGEKNDR